MNLEDLSIPPGLIEADRCSILLYVICALHADDNGVCQPSRWLGAVGGLNREEYERARAELLTLGLAEVIEYKDDYGTCKGLRLLQWRGVRRHERLTWAEWKRIRSSVFERDGYTCAYCLTQFQVADLECDHIEPISQGGTNEMGNLVTACQKCNREKRGNVIQLWRDRRA